jgi:hypothetical protein
VEEFLETAFAENVVQEIWRSKYATADQIFTASTNHSLLFDWWHCLRDLEAEVNVLKMKDLNSIEAHPF